MQVWLDCERVLVATKCNQLLELSTRTGERRSIQLPPVPARTHATVDSGWGNCGIHAIDINPSRGLLVTGGANPTDAVVLRLPDYRPVQTLTVGGESCVREQKVFWVRVRAGVV